jgi:hypothetical protein
LKLKKCLIQIILIRKFISRIFSHSECPLFSWGCSYENFVNYFLFVFKNLHDIVCSIYVYKFIFLCLIHKKRLLSGHLLLFDSTKRKKYFYMRAIKEATILCLTYLLNIFSSYFMMIFRMSIIPNVLMNFCPYFDFL